MKVWASQFPFLHSLKEVIPPIEACCMAILIGLWHRLILWVSLSLSHLRGVTRPGHGLGSNSQYRRDLCQGLCQGLVGHLCLRGLTWRVGMRLIQVARSLLVAVSPPVLLSQEEKGGVGVSTHDVPEPSTSSASSSSTSAAFQVGMLFKFFVQWRSITSNRFVLNMVWGHHLQLRSHPPLFCDFRAVMSRQQQLINLLFRRRLMSFLLRVQQNPPQVVPVSILACLWYLSILGAFDQYSNLEHFNHYMHIPSFKMPTLKHVWQLIQHGDYAFSIDLQDAYLHIPIVKHHHGFLHFVWHNVPYQWKVLPFGLATVPRVFTSLTKPFLFLCHCKGLCIVIVTITIW